MSPPTEGNGTRMPREEQEIKQSKSTQSNTHTFKAKSSFFTRAFTLGQMWGKTTVSQLM